MFKIMKKIENSAGIYRIINIKNNKVYIGSTTNLYKRRREHFYQLKKEFIKISVFKIHSINMEKIIFYLKF